MSFIICIAALCFLMFVAYRGFSVILFAPVAALLAVLLTDPQAILPIYSGLFMENMVDVPVLLKRCARNYGRERSSAEGAEIAPQQDFHLCFARCEV